MKKRSIVFAAMILSIMLLGCGKSEETALDVTSIEQSGQTQEETPDTSESADNTVKEENVTDIDETNTEDISGYPAFDFESKTVTLNSGYEMPILGLGMFNLSDSEAENSTYWALKAGFRLIDTASIYGNEEAVGRGLRRAIDEGIVTREEVFITTKMWTSDFDNGDAAIDASLDRLGVDYIDLMILLLAPSLHDL